MSRNQCILLLLLCIITGTDVLILAVAAAVSPMPRTHYYSLPSIPWVSSNYYSSRDDDGTFVSIWRWIKRSLPNHDTVSSSYLLYNTLSIRGGDNDLDLSDIDDDVAAEDLLDAIFDSTTEKTKKSQGSAKRSVEKKASILDGVLDLDASESDIKGHNISTKSKARTATEQKRSTRINRKSTPKLEQGSRSSSSSAFISPNTLSAVKVESNTSDYFREELERLSEKPMPLPNYKRKRQRPNGEGQQKRNEKKDPPRTSNSYSIGEELLADSFVSKRRDELDELVQDSSKQSAEEASPETSANIQQIRAAPTVSTSGIPTTSHTKSVSPAFIRKSLATNSPTPSRHHAVWGPHAQHRKVKPGPPPTKATEDERRAHEEQSRIRQERKSLLSNLALRMQDSHTLAIQSLIKGNAAHIPPELFGQTIMQEKSACNEKFYGSVTELQSSLRRGTSADEVDGTVLGEEIDAVPSFRHIEDPTLLSYWGLTPHAKLYGGAQYHRVLRYYHHMFLTVPLPPITDDEVALLTNGITEVHDASDLMRAVALLVRQKMEIVMEDVLADMTRRLLYVMDRQWEMVEYSMALHRPMGGANGLGKSGDKVLTEAELLNKYGIEYNTAESSLKDILRASFHNFAREMAEAAHRQSLEDIQSLLRYVTWDMGRARKRVPNQPNNNQGFVSQIEIVGRETPQSNESEMESTKANRRQMKKKAKKVRQKNNKSQSLSGASERVVARGGGAVGSGRKRSRRRKEEASQNQGLQRDNETEHSEEDVMGDLIGGVMNRGRLEDSDDENHTTGSNQSMILSSQSSPLFSGDDEVLSVLLATVSSTLAPKSDIQAGHTQAAIENLVSYVTDRMRMDMSRIIRSKFNTFFLLPFYESLGPYLGKELNTYLSNMD